MHTVCHVIKRLEKLAVDHAYQIIQRGVCIRDTAEKGNFSFSHAGKIQFISIGQLGDLRQIEAASRTPTLIRMDLAVFPETDCQGFLIKFTKIYKKVPEAPYGS